MRLDGEYVAIDMTKLLNLSSLLNGHCSTAIVRSLNLTGSFCPIIACDLIAPTALKPR